MCTIPLDAHLMTGRDALAGGEALPVAVLLVFNLLKRLEFLRDHFHRSISILSGKSQRRPVVADRGRPRLEEWGTRARAGEVAQEPDADAERGGQPAGAQPLRDGRLSTEDRRHTARSQRRCRRVRDGSHDPRESSCRHQNPRLKIETWGTRFRDSFRPGPPAVRQRCDGWGTRLPPREIVSRLIEYPAYTVSHETNLSRKRCHYRL